MSERIPQSVSYLVVFRAFLSSDGKTLATGKTIAITISKNGGAFGNPNAGATNATELSSGFYKFTLDTTDTGTAGPLAWRGAEGTINDAGDVLTVSNAHNAGFDALPNAAAEAAGGIYTRGAGAGQINQDANGRIDANVKTWIGGTIPAVNVTGVPLVDAKYLLGTIIATPATAGILDVNAKNWNNVVVTGMPMPTYTQPVGFLAATFPSGTLANTTNISQATGIDVTKWGGTVIATPNTPGVPIVDTRRLVRQGTAQATGNSTTAIKLDAGASGTNDFYKHMLIQVISGTGAPQMGICTAYNGGTKIATISPAWPTVTDGTSGFQIHPAMVDPVVAVNANLTQILGMALSESNGGNLALAVSSFFDVGTTASRCDFISQVHFVDEVTGNVDGDVVGSIHALTGAAVDSIWQDALGGGGFTGPSTIGKLLKDNIDALISSRAATGAAMTLTAAYDFAKGTAAMAESYAANGQQPTAIQALYAIHQMLMQFAISGVDYQVKKLDNSTTAFIVTLNDGTNPTSAVRT